MLALIFVFTVCVSALDLSVESVEASRAQTVSVSVVLSEEVMVKGGAVELVYDASVMDFVSAEWNVSRPLMKNFDTNTKKGAFAYMSATAISGELFTATFLIHEDADFGSYPVSMTVQLKDGSNTDIALDNKSGMIFVSCSAHDFTGTNTSHVYLKQAADCDSAAEYYYSCTICGVASEETFFDGDPADHEFTCQNTDEAYLRSAADCENAATYYFSCACGVKGEEFFEYGEIAADNHTFGDPEVIREADHLEEGEQKLVCEICEHETTESIPKTTEHSYGAWENHNDQTHKKTCACGSVVEEAHAWGEGEVVETATADTEGKRVFTCSICGAEKQETLDKLPAETETETETEAETEVETEVETEAETVAETEETKTSSGGCFAVINLGAVSILMAAAAAVALKKKD